MGEIYAFDNNSNNALLIENEIEKQLMLLKEFDWFHGILERKDAEKKISMNGEFLVRLSRDRESKFVVSTKWNGKYIHVIIKNDVEVVKKQLVYFIVPKFKFNSISELIEFHKAEQYPLSITSEAVLYRAVMSSEIGKKEHKFRKSTRPSHKPQSKLIPRSGSETLLASHRYSANYPGLNSSLTSLPTIPIDAPSKPSKPILRFSTIKAMLPDHRPSNIEIRNEKLFAEGGDYSDYLQSRDVVGGLEREKKRRGLSVDVLSPSLFGLKRGTFNKDTEGSRTQFSSQRDNSSDYVPPGRQVSGSNRPLSEEDSGSYLPLRRESAPAFVAPGRYSNNGYSHSTSVNTSNDIYVAPGNPSNRPITNLTTGSTSNTNNIYVAPGNTQTQSSTNLAPGITSSLHTMTPPTPTPINPSSSQSDYSLHPFLDLCLSKFPLPCCGPIEGAFDPAAINKAASFLLSNPSNPIALCTHLIDELHRIFTIISTDLTGFKPGYRCFFMIGSNQCHTDLTIRQSAFTNFVMATIVNTTSNERRIQLIVFWIKCADHLLTRFCDMFHFRSVVTAIFSEQVSNLKVWKTLYRNDSSMKSRMLSLRQAISEDCFMRTDIDKCVPDIVELYGVFTRDDDDFDRFCQISADIMRWSSQSFDDKTTWLATIRGTLNSNTTIPFLQELVQTETLLCLLIGRNTISYSDIGALMKKVEECIKVMADLRNNST